MSNLCGINTGAQNPRISNNVKGPIASGSHDVSSRFTPSKEIGLQNKGLDAPIDGGSAYPRTRSDIRSGTLCPNGKAPAYTPSNLAKTFSNIEQQASSALLSAGIFASVVGGPAVMGIGVASAVVGVVGEVVNPYVAPTVDAIRNVFAE